MAEIAFEYLAMALETVPGTAQPAPTSYMNLFGNVKPIKEYYEPEESTGMLAELMRVKETRKFGEWSADGPLDLIAIIELLSLIAKGGVSPTTPTNGVLTRDWEFVPTMLSDDLKMATLFYGDPNMTDIFRGSYGILNDLTISSDASGTDGATLSAGGICKYPAKFTAPSMPTQVFGPLVAGVNMSLYIDTSSAIGTTAITGRFVSAEHVLAGMIEPKYVAAGPTADLSYSRHGRGKRSLTSTVVMELVDYDQYDLAALKDTVCKMRVEHHGEEIESVSPIYYYGLTVDTYGPLRMNDWGDLGGTNRTIGFQIKSQYDATLAADWRIMVRNEQTALAA